MRAGEISPTKSKESKMFTELGNGRWDFAYKIWEFPESNVLRYGRSSTAGRIWPELLPEKMVSAMTRLVFWSQSKRYQ
ncbi:hypothetical protein ACH5RR_007406 [Cinchona calisaya]|uniref:Uncharacterized protein n=1 Tax=Cinchona calisaya TaxID=153742 RepID=A0ABD3ARU8_9GENT